MIQELQGVEANIDKTDADVPKAAKDDVGATKGGSS